MRLVSTKVVALNVAALIALAGPVTDGLVPGLVFTSPPSVRSQIHTLPTGNVEVEVPPVPPIDSLPVLCEVLLAGYAQAGAPHVGSREMRDLYAATGGSRTTARAWCDRFISGSLISSVSAAVPAGL